MHSKTLQILGTLTCTAALVTLYGSVLTTDWLTIQEPQLDQNELDKLGPYDDDPKPHLLKARLGLLKICVQKFKFNAECFEIRNLVFYGEVNVNMPSELIANCVDKMRLTLPFIFLSVFFTSAAFLSLTFGHFCPKNKKIIEASMLILGGLCQATALLTFVSQIGSEFEANLPFDNQTKTKMLFYRYKYGYSFYLFLLSFSLSELAALFDMAGYFKGRKTSTKDFVIAYDHTGHQMENSPLPEQAFFNNENKHHHHPDICCNELLAPEDHQHQLQFMNQEVITITTNPYATVKRGVKDDSNKQMLESFATLRAHNNTASVPISRLNRL